MALRGPHGTGIIVASTPFVCVEVNMAAANEALLHGLFRCRMKNPSLDLRDMVNLVTGSNVSATPRHAGELTRQVGEEGRFVI